MADFSLQRITHAVRLLEWPERHQDPLILKEYTDDMVKEADARL